MPKLLASSSFSDWDDESSFDGCEELTYPIGTRINPLDKTNSIPCALTFVKRCDPECEHKFCNSLGQKRKEIRQKTLLLKEAIRFYSEDREKRQNDKAELVRSKSGLVGCSNEDKERLSRVYDAMVRQADNRIRYCSETTDKLQNTINDLDLKLEEGASAMRYATYVPKGDAVVDSLNKALYRVEEHEECLLRMKDPNVRVTKRPSKGMSSFFSAALSDCTSWFTDMQFSQEDAWVLISCLLSIFLCFVSFAFFK